jgi:hypothetical protein
MQPVQTSPTWKIDAADTNRMFYFGLLRIWCGDENLGGGGAAFQHRANFGCFRLLFTPEKVSGFRWKNWIETVMRWSDKRAADCAS